MEWISIIISAIIAVSGWFIIDKQNRKIRREEAMRAVYYKLFDQTNSMINDMSAYCGFIGRRTADFERLIKDMNKESDEDKKVEKLKEWGDKVTVMIDESFVISQKILDYMRILDMGGTNYGGDTDIYKALSSISLDANRALRKITNLWINNVNFYNMSEVQFEEMRKETKAELTHVYELCGCLDDILVYAYNDYIAKPLKLSQRDLVLGDKRRYIMRDGKIRDERQAIID
jgi:hypothetical protein